MLEKRCWLMVSVSEKAGCPRLRVLSQHQHRLFLGRRSRNPSTDGPARSSNTNHQHQLFRYFGVRSSGSSKVSGFSGTQSAGGVVGLPK